MLFVLKHLNILKHLDQSKLEFYLYKNQYNEYVHLIIKIY